MRVQKEVRIKYDRQTMTIIKGVSIVATILFVLGLALMVMEIAGTEIFTVSVLFLGGGSSIVSYGALVAGWLYRRRLEKYGYRMPERKRDYGNVIRNLPRQKPVERTSLFSGYSRWGCRACILMFAVFLVLDIRYFLQWKFMGENCRAMFVLCLLFYLIWIFLALVLKKQSNKERYRDDVEPDTARKERRSPEEILFTIIILCLLSFYVNDTAHSMTRYIYQEMTTQDSSIDCNTF